MKTLPKELPDNNVIIGQVIGLYGVRGWVKVFSHTKPRESILNFNPWLIKRGDDWQEMALAEGRQQGKNIIARLAGVDDRDVAAQLMQADIAVERQQLPAIEDDEYYWTDLEGLQVITVDGATLGVVSHLLETGANDVLVVNGERQRLIPYVRDEVIRKVDLAQGEIIVAWDPEF
ncbi:MAG TPA: ribosome maturation factor RimM [Gammaproteobacteria bacterium]|nr:ribosome maturation factor RimM [Gammaproteobacteria bacterium]